MEELPHSLAQDPTQSPCQPLVDSFFSAFEQSREHFESTQDLLLAGSVIRLHCTSPQLGALLGQSISGMAGVPGVEALDPSLHLYMWSGRDATPRCNELLAEFARYPDKSTVINDSGLHLQFNPDGDILSLIDCSRGLAFYYAPDAEKLPDYEVCTPFRMLLNWFCNSIGLHFVHAASVGHDGRAALLVGHSGAGKSTTALTGLLHGLDFVGDDYVAISNGSEVCVHALYRGCKLTENGLLRLPQMRGRLIETNRTGDKNVAMLDASAGSLVDTLPVRAIVRPVVAGRDASSFERVRAISVLSEFAGSTVMQMPGTGAPMLSALASVCKRLPIYRMHMSRDPAEIADSLRSLLAAQRP